MSPIVNLSSDATNKISLSVCSRQTSFYKTIDTSKEGACPNYWERSGLILKHWTRLKRPARVNNLFEELIMRMFTSGFSTMKLFTSVNYLGFRPQFIYSFS